MVKPLFGNKKGTGHRVPPSKILAVLHDGAEAITMPNACLAWNAPSVRPRCLIIEQRGEKTIGSIG